MSASRGNACSRPRSPAACPSRPGSPNRTCCGRRGSSTGDELAAAKRDATLLAIKQQEDAGIDIVTDGEQSRQHFVHGFLENVEGIDFGRRVEIGIRNNRYKAMVPTVTGALRLRGRVHATEARLARAHTTRQLKFTLPGPMTIVDTIADTHYGDRVTLAMAFAALLNEEARALAADGVDVIQFDEPAFNVYMDAVADWGIAALERAAEGLACKTAVHICYGYGIQANIDWKGTLGAEWRQYEETFPALAASRIDQVSLECRNSRVPMRADAAARRQGRAGRRDRRRHRSRGDARGGRRHHRRGAGIRAGRAAVPVHQLRHGADAPRRGGGQARGARCRCGAWRGGGSRRSVCGDNRRGETHDPDGEQRSRAADGAAQDRQRLAHHLHRREPQHAEGRARRRPRPARCIRWRSWWRRSRMRW